MANDIDIPYDDRAFGAVLHEKDDGWVLELVEGASTQSVVQEVIYGCHQLAAGIAGGERSLDDPENVAEYFLLRLEAAGYTAERIKPDRDCVALWSLATPPS
jgi:hypothetical protein